MAVLVNDPDGYYLPNGRENVWNGDCVQFRVDPMGPNSYLKYKNPEYDYKTEGFNADKCSGIGYVPWAYRTKICNVGMGIPADNNDPQVYDMADQGTGEFERSQKLNDPKKLGPVYVDEETGKTHGNPFGTDVDYASLFGCKTIDNGDGTSTNSYEVAVPWAYIDQWGFGQVAVGYAWGMSLVVLNGYDDKNALTSPYESYLTWGSGICGAQQDDSWLRPTLGGSNAIILSNKDALNPEQIVEKDANGVDLPVATDDVIGGDTEVKHNIIDVTGSKAYYFSSTDELVTNNGCFEFNMDIAYLGADSAEPDKTYVGVLVGDGYGMAAGWNANTQEFVIAPQGFDNGLDLSGDVPYAAGDEFDWQIGDWHNIGIKVEGEEITITCDGKEVLYDTDMRYPCTGGNEGNYQIIVYNIGDFAYDNLKITTSNGSCDYTFDSDDAAFNSSDMKLNAIPMGNKIVEGVCKNADPESLCNCLVRPGVNEAGKRVMKCDFCDYEEAIATVMGDANGDGNVTLDDVTSFLQVIAGWTGVTIDDVAADVNADGKSDINDVTLILQKIAGWDVEF